MAGLVLGRRDGDVTGMMGIGGGARRGIHGMVDEQRRSRRNTAGGPGRHPRQGRAAVLPAEGRWSLNNR